MERELHNIKVIKKNKTNENIIVLKCTGCGAGLGATEKEEIMECPYCNTKVLLTELKKKKPSEEEKMEETPAEKSTVIENPLEEAITEEKPVLDMPVEEGTREEKETRIAFASPSLSLEEKKLEEKPIIEDNHEVHTVIGVNKEKKDFLNSIWFDRLAGIALVAGGFAITTFGIKLNAITPTESGFLTQAIGAFVSLFGSIGIADGFFGTHIIRNEDASEVKDEVEVDNNISATMSAMNNGAQLLPSEEKSEEYITAEFHRQL